MGESGSKPLLQTVTDSIVDYRGALVAVVAVVSALMVLLATGIRIDRSLNLWYDAESHEYNEYQRFKAAFGEDEFLLLVVATNHPIDNPELLGAVERANRELNASPMVAEALSLANLRIPQLRDGLLCYPRLLENVDGRLRLDRASLRRLSERWRELDLFTTPDLKSAGFLVRLADQVRYTEKEPDLINWAESVLKAQFPPESRVYAAGAPLLRSAFYKYSLQTTLMFILFGLAVGTAAAVFLFKSLKVTVIVGVANALAVLWVVGIIGLLRIELNLTATVFFGFITITTTATVIHITTHFNEKYRIHQDAPLAAKLALRIVGLPCLMCSLTTSVGFASLLVTSIPMIRQAGLIISLGVVASFVVVLIVAPTLLIVVKPAPKTKGPEIERDLISQLLSYTKDMVFRRHRLFAASFPGVIVVCFVGMQGVRIDTHLARMLDSSVPEAKSIRFIEDNVAPLCYINVMVEGEPNAFSRAKELGGVNLLENKMRAIPEVKGVESIQTVACNLYRTLEGIESCPDVILKNPKVFREMLALASFSPHGKALREKYISDDQSQVRLTAKVRLSSEGSLLETIGRIREKANESFSGDKKITVTGDMALAAIQSEGLVKDQIVSLAMAGLLITLLLMIQFRSVLLGLLSLIPNFLPLAAILGFMGYVGIYLDSTTALVAVISFGLSVDDTIHFLTHLQRELAVADTNQGFKGGLLRAYDKSGRAIISTSVVLSVSCLTLTLAPFGPVANSGFLYALAIATALVGDLIFMPAIILSSNSIQRFVQKEAAHAGTKGKAAAIVTPRGYR